MGVGCLGVILLLTGFGILTGGGGVGLNPNPNPTATGGLMLAAGAVLTAAGAWQDVATRRQISRDREAAVSQLERLARLRDQGALTGDEFEAQKRAILRATPGAG